MIALSSRDKAERLAMITDALAQPANAPGTSGYDKLVAMREELGWTPECEASTEDGAPRIRRGGEAASNQYGTFEVHTASEKQVAFLKRLIAEKVTDGIKLPATVDGISKKGASALIDKLIDRPNKPVEVTLPNGGSITTPSYKIASEKQISLITKLAGEKQLDEGLRNSVDAVLENVEIAASKVASEVIDRLFAAPRKTIAVSVKLESGIYRTADGEIFKVYTNQAGTRMLAKKLMLGEQATFSMQHGFDHDPGKPWWEYAGMADRFVQREWKMTLEDAKAFGTIYGVCCNCGRTLTDEGSIEAGIGPVCASKGSWA